MIFDLINIAEFSALVKFFAYLLPLLGVMGDPDVEDPYNRQPYGTRGGQPSTPAADEAKEPENDPHSTDESPDGTKPTPNSSAARSQRERQLRSANYRRQCFLLNHWEPILKETRHWRRGHGGYAAFDISDYEMISCINSQPALLMNQVHGGPGLDDFFDLTTAQQSALVPQIRLWKVWFQNGIPDPTREPQEFVFDSKLSSEDLAMITRTRRGRASGVGLVEVNVDDQSTMIGETNKRFLVEFKFRFQSMEDIIKVLNPGAEKNQQIRWVDLISPSPDITGIDTSKEPRECEEEGNNSFNPDHYVIKTSIGWGIPKSMSGGGTDVLFGARKKQITRALKAAKKTFFLGLIEHSFDFKQDGTVELISSYQAWTEASYSSNQYSDLLFPAMNKEEREKLMKERRRLVERLERRRARGSSREAELASQGAYDPTWLEKNLGGFSEDSSGANYQDRFEEVHQIRQATIERELRADKAMRYNRIIRNLYRQNLPTYSMWVSKKTIYDSFAPLEADADPVHISTADLSPSLLRTAGFIDSTLENADSDEDAQKSVRKRITDNSSLEKQKKKSKNPEWVEINFTFLGSLIDSICLTLREGNSGLFDTRVLMGPAVVRLGNPRNPAQRVTKIVNLADVPVSIKAFENFWLEKVVKPMRDTYKLSEFLRDIVNEFLLQVLDSDCLDREDIEDKGEAMCKDKKIDPFPRKAVALDYFSLQRKSGQAEGDPGEPPIPTGKKIQLNAKNCREIFRLDEYQDQVSVVHYALLYLNNPSLRGFKGDFEEDQAQGVYHLYIGRDRGIVKSMSFKKLDDPLLKASQLTKNIDEGSILPIPEPYDVTIETFGNALFKPGQKVYVIPSFLFKAGSTGGINLAQQLMIGGYYNVLKVNSLLTPETFTTTLEARWESSGLTKEGQEHNIDNAYPYFDIAQTDPDHVLHPELQEQINRAAEESVEDVADPDLVEQEEEGVQYEMDPDDEPANYDDAVEESDVPDWLRIPGDQPETNQSIPSRQQEPESESLEEFLESLE